MKSVNRKSYSLYLIILWYSILTIGVGILLNLMAIIYLPPNGEISTLILSIFFMLVKVLFLFLFVVLLKGSRGVYLLNFILFYWVAQTFFFGFFGNVYAFTTGPHLAVYFKFVDVFDVGFITKFWSQELTLKINSSSDKFYIGINAIPVIITIILAYALPPGERIRLEKRNKPS